MLRRQKVQKICFNCKYFEYLSGFCSNLLQAVSKAFSKIIPQGLSFKKIKNSHFLQQDPMKAQNQLHYKKSNSSNNSNNPKITNPSLIFAVQDDPEHNGAPVGQVQQKLTAETVDFFGVVGLVGDPAVPAELKVVGAPDDLGLLTVPGVDGVTLVALGGVPVEHEQQVVSLEDYDFVGVVLGPDVLVLRRQQVVIQVQLDHVPIESEQELIPQVLILAQVPSPAAVVITPSVTLPGEVDPLGVPELVAHEIEIGLPAQAEGNQPDHLVQGHAAKHPQGLVVEHGHVGVDLGVEQPHGEGLVTNKGLVMALSIADTVLLPAPIGELVDNVAHVPVLVPGLLQQLDPHVGYGHGQPEVEPHPAVLNAAAQAGEA